MSEGNGEANPERVQNLPPGSAAAARRKIAGWIVFGAVAVFWLPFLLMLVTDFGNPLPPFDTAIEFVALSSLWGLPLALACGLIRWAGNPRTAWVMLASVGTATLLWSVVVVVAGASGRSSLTAQQQAIGEWAAVLSLPAWFTYALLPVRRYRKRRAMGVGSRGDGEGGSEMRNRSGDPD